MDYYYKDDDDEHDEDDLPEVSLPMSSYTRKISNEDDKSLDNWRNLYETSIQSLQSDEDDQRLISQKPFYLERPIPIAQPPNGRPDSPISEPEIPTNPNKSKWEIRLPELLNATVGPDRQKRDVSRRHTTDIVFQQSQELNRYNSQNDGNQPINPLVKQLKQKFDRMTTNNPPTPDKTQNNFHIPKYQRLDSITARELTTNTGTRLAPRSRPALPIRPTPEITTVKSRSDSVNSRTTVTNNRNHRDKPGPPVSYPKHYYPPPSTTSVVKQLIGSGATLVYDSKTQKSSIKPKPLIKNQRSIEQTREDLKNTNSVLTGRQIKPEQLKIKKNNHQPQPIDDDSDENYYDPMTEPSNYRRYSNASDQQPYYPISNNTNKKK